jgi:pyruvate dehydrogenase E2 component (dihydrolipoamide acetyltransferase)
MAEVQEVKVPDIGDFKDVEIIEVLVSAGDEVHEEDPLITLESDKASMEVPSPASGTVKEVKVKTGGRVSEGDVIVLLEAGEAKSKVEPPSPEGVQESDAHPIEAPEEPKAEKSAAAPAAKGDGAAKDFSGVHASPSVRRLAREFEVDLTALKGSGEKGRITKDDVKAHLAGGAPAAAAAPPSGAGIPEIPAVDRSG